MNKKLMIICLSIGGFFIICAMFCCIGGLLDRDIETPVIIDSTATSTKPTTKPKPTKEIIGKIDADTLIKEYDENEIAADQKYKNKKYEITGQINDISEVLNSLTVTLSSEEFALTTVRLKLKDKDKSIVAKLQKSEEITVIGIIEGKGWDVDVKEVVFK